MRSVDELSTEVELMPSARSAHAPFSDRPVVRAPSAKPTKLLKRPASNAADILKAFNTWAFKREQPDSTGMLLASLQRSVDAGAPLRFVLYWGKGPRNTLAGPDIQCLDYLVSMKSRIEAIYAPGTEFTLILTDTHARLNGHTESAMDDYFQAVTTVAQERGFHLRRLSEIVATSGSDLDATASPPPELLDHLESCARKWYRGSNDTVEGALIYYRMNMVEKNAVERAFPGSVFVTFNGSDVRDLFPTGLPIFYMYSLKRGTAEKPWFLPRIVHLSEADLA